MPLFRLTPEEKVSLGDRLRVARYAARLTVRAVAHRTRVSTNTVNHWEHGGIPSDELRPVIAQLYGVDQRFLFSEYEDRLEDYRTQLHSA